MANPLDWVRALLAKAAPDFQVPPGGKPIPPAEIARMQDSFGASGPNASTLGPGVPPVPTPLDTTPQPRAFQYRVGWNIPSLPGEGRPLDFTTLRQLADTYDILRKAIEVRKDEMASLRLTIIARDADRRRAKEIIRDQQDKVKAIEEFFTYPDKKHTWQAWLRALLEDYFVVDSVTIWKWRTLGGELHGLRLLDGSTIKPLLTIQGDTPTPPDWAYQQYLYGVARWSFTTDELIYAPKNTRVHSPYGFSPVEQFLTHINEALRYQQFRTAFFTDGSLPEGVAEAPATWTAAQIEEFNTYWNSMLAGDPRAFRKLQFVPAGFKFHEFKPWTFDQTFARWLVGVTSAALDVSPQELGFEPLHSGLGGKGFAEEQTSIHKRKSIGPLMRWLADNILNPIIWTEFDAPFLQAAFQEEQEEEDQLTTMQARDIAVRNGTLSIDQVVEEEGGEPPGIGRLFVVGNQVLFESDLIQGSLHGASSLQPSVPAKGTAGAPSSSAPEDGQRAAPEAKPTDDGEQQMQQDLQESRTRADQEQTAPPPHAHTRQDETKMLAARNNEMQRFLRFARDHQKAGKWRDFRSAILAADTLAALNKAAQGGASADELRALVGLHAQPERIKRRLADTEKAYRGVSGRLAKRVAEMIEGQVT